MKYILLSVLAMLQLPLFAQMSAADANAVLDKALSVLKADLPVRMDYVYDVLDDERESLQGDKGVIYIDSDRYALLMQDMKVWCDGSTQWSYMREVDEVYVSDADSDEAQNLSPLYVMEHYREGCSVSATSGDGVVTVHLRALAADAGVENVDLVISKNNYRLLSMVIAMPGQGSVEVALDGYVAKCGVGDDVFKCPLEQFTTSEIIDMR